MSGNAPAAGQARLGRYSVERFLARGGMAEVYLGRAAGPAGFSKPVVIKRLLREYADDHRFVQMFLDEARLAAMLNHPNIAQVYDFGKDERGGYYLAMEFVDGESLRRILRLLFSKDRTISTRVAALVGIALCEALHYAHELRDETGTPFNIVHRDVTPDNVQISTSGTVKLLDFGIAKGATSQVKTGDGQFKGKLAYVTREQIDSLPLNRQVDVYAVGVTLYEMVVGFTPFKNNDPIALMKQILDEEPVPAHVANPSVDRAFSDLVHKAIAPKREDRTKSARELQEALEGYLAANGPRPSSDAMAELVREVREVMNAAGPQFTDPAAQKLPSDLLVPSEVISVDVDVDFSRPPTAGVQAYKPGARPSAPDTAASKAVAPRKGGLRALPLTVGIAGGVLVTSAVLIGLGAHMVQSRKLDKELAEVDRLVAAGRLSGSEDETALAHVHRAQDMAAGDPRVERKVQELVSAFEKLGDVAFERGNFEEAMVHYSDAQSLAPERRDLAQKVRKAANARAKKAP